jgi:hypothetical protein
MERYIPEYVRNKYIQYFYPEDYEIERLEDNLLDIEDRNFGEKIAEYQSYETAYQYEAILKPYYKTKAIEYLQELNKYMSYEEIKDFLDNNSEIFSLISRLIDEENYIEKERIEEEERNKLINAKRRLQLAKMIKKYDQMDPYMVENIGSKIGGKRTKKRKKVNY